MAVLWICMGAVLGALGRFGLQKGLSLVFPSLPLGTTVANSLGCLLIGVFGAHIMNHGDHFKLFFFTGLLGSLTTLSSLQFETFTLIQEARYLAAFTHWFLGAVAGFAFVLLGYAMGQKLSGLV